MIKNRLATAKGRWVGAGFALMSLSLLTACQPEASVQPTQPVKADSTAVMSDPPVSPDGPGGGK